jgi:hypothetical protein
MGGKGGNISEAVSDIRSKSARLTDQPVVESQATLTRVALCDGVLNIVAISEILRPHSDVNAARGSPLARK